MSETPPPPPAPSTRPPSSQHRFPCVSCGSDLRFDPGRGVMHCDHCGHEEPVEDQAGPWAHPLRELDFETALGAALPEAEMEEIQVSKCPNCGAEVELAGAEHAAECPFCATPVVAGTGIHRHIKPRGVLPFAVSDAAAHQAMTTWLGTLWFAPNGLKEYARKGRRMQGIYVPYWTFDADTRSEYRGERGTTYYETRTVMRDGKPQTQTVPRIRWTPRAGRVARFFDDVLVLASRSLPRSHTDALEPWDLSALTPYKPDFLAGFRAEGYQVPLEEGFEQARAKMDRVIERDVRFDIGGDHQRIHAIDTSVSGVTFKHVLLPVWLAAYKFRGETYRFVVNGQSGRVQGERPWSAWKIALAVIVGLILAAIVGYVSARS